MFTPDRPINNDDQDFLGRTKFAKKMGETLTSWNEQESLVIALYGKWGSGKSSIINLAVNQIKKNKQQPTIFEFNPWVFSGNEDIEKVFFEELAKRLNLSDKSESDQKLAKKLRSYSQLLGLIPNKSDLAQFYSKIIIGLSLFLGISWNFSTTLEKYPLLANSLKYVVPGVSFLLLIIGTFRKIAQTFADYFTHRNEAWTAQEFKKNICNDLKKREKKLLIIIDDIDRLTQEEIKQVFKIVRVNADFPNTIYVLSFDRKIIEENLEVQRGIRGSDYLDKIVQVSFDVPFSKLENTHKFLFQELNQVIDKLPDSREKYFNETHWGNVFHAGLKDFFGNIRAIKRFINSLKFNFSLLHHAEVIEVNIVDFIAVEVFRVFLPEFYSFMKGNGELFTKIEESGNTEAGKKERKNKIDKALENVPEPYRQSVTNLLLQLFPQLKSIYENNSYGSGWLVEWEKTLRISVPEMYDCYFSLIPGGSEAEISQYDLEDAIRSAEKLETFEALIKKLLSTKKIRKFLDKFQTIASDNVKINSSNAENIILGLFNASEELPTEKTGLFDFGPDMDVSRVIYQLLKNRDKEENFSILKSALTHTVGLLCPLRMVSGELGSKSEKSDLLEKNRIQELKQICLDKIYALATSGQLQTNKSLVLGLYFWKEWGDPITFNEYMGRLQDADDKFVYFLEGFIIESFNHTITDYVPKRKRIFGHDNLKRLVEIDAINSRLINIKNSNSELYQKHQSNIDFMIKKLESAKKGRFFDDDEN